MKFHLKQPHMQNSDTIVDQFARLSLGRKLYLVAFTLAALGVIAYLLGAVQGSSECYTNC